MENDKSIDKVSKESMVSDIHLSSKGFSKFVANEVSVNIVTGEKEIDLDEALKDTGPRFRFRVILHLCLWYVSLTTAYNMMSSVFTGDEPSWKCARENANTFCEMNFNKTIHRYDVDFSVKCEMNRSDWQFITPKEYSFVTEFDLSCKKTSLAALVSSSFYMGGFLGTLFSGFFADRYGRKPVLFFSLIVLIMSSIGLSFTANIWQLIGINIILGGSLVANFYTIYVYVSEFVVPKDRAFSTCIIHFAGTSSFLLLDFLAYMVRNWRHLQLYTAILPAFGPIMFFILPESPRWLLGKERKSDSIAVLEMIRKVNGHVQTQEVRLKSPEKRNKKVYTYLDLINKFEVFKLTSCNCTIWFSTIIVYYTIAMESSNLGGDMYMSFAISTTADYVAFIVGTIALNRFGRKPPILGGLFVSGILMGLTLFVPKSASYRYVANIVISTLARCMVCISFAGMFTWTSELYPTVLRSQGMSTSIVFDRLGMFCCPFITRILGNFNPSLPLIISCVFGILASLIGLFLPETKNCPTRESYEDIFQDKSMITNEIGNDNRGNTANSD